MLQMEYIFSYSTTAKLCRPYFHWIAGMTALIHCHVYNQWYGLFVAYNSKILHEGWMTAVFFS